MKNKLFYLVLFSLAVFAFACEANETNSVSTESEVLALDDQRYAAREKGDADTMSRIYADDYTLITAEGVLRSKSDQIDEMRSQQLGFNPIQILERSVRIYGDSAIVLAHEHSSIIRNGQEIGGNFRTSRIYVHRDGRWQLVQIQATRIAETEQ